MHFHIFGNMNPRTTYDKENMNMLDNFFCFFFNTLKSAVRRNGRENSHNLEQRWKVLLWSWYQLYLSMTHFHETIIITPCEIRKWISIHLIFRGIHLLIWRVFWKKSSDWVPEGIGWPTDQLANLISHNPFPNFQHSQLEITIWLSWRWHGNGHTETDTDTRTPPQYSYQNAVDHH